MVPFHHGILPKFFKEDVLVQAIFSITVLLIVLIFPTGSLWGAEFCVDDASALQTALSTAASNDEDNIIQIARGITYLGNFFYATDKGKEIVIRGGYDKSRSVCTFPTALSSPSETILDGSGAGRVLRVSDNGDGNIVVERLTFRNGNSTGDGGGLLASSGASGDSGDVRISYNIMVSCNKHSFILRANRCKRGGPCPISNSIEFPVWMNRQRLGPHLTKRLID